LKAWFVKIVLIGSLAGFVLGLTIAVALTVGWGSSGSMNSDETGKLIFIFLVLPASMTLVLAVMAAVAVGILRYFYWVSGDSSGGETPGLSNGLHQDGNSPPAA